MKIGSVDTGNHGGDEAGNANAGSTAGNASAGSTSDGSSVADNKRSSDDNSSKVGSASSVDNSRAGGATAESSERRLGDDSLGRSPDREKRSSTFRFALMVAFFVTCTVLGVWWAAPTGDIVSKTGAALAALGVSKLVLLVAIGLAAIAAEMYRLYVFGRVIGVHVGARAAFDASVANDLFSWISPAGLAGEPASVYVMSRRGVPFDGALAITFAKFATSFALIYGVSAGLLFAGYGPPIAHWAILSIAITILFGVGLCGSFLAGTLWPKPFGRLVDRIEVWLLRRWLCRGPLGTRVVTASAKAMRGAIDRLALYRDVGIGGWLAMTASHLLYYGVYIGLLLVLAWMFDAQSLAAVLPIAVIYHGFTYIAPAPGIPEAGAALFFGSQFSDANALIVVLLFRALTAYLQVLLGLIYLPVIGSLRAILTRRPANQSSR